MGRFLLHAVPRMSLFREYHKLPEEKYLFGNTLILLLSSSHFSREACPHRTNIAMTTLRFLLVNSSENEPHWKKPSTLALSQACSTCTYAP